MPETIKRNQEDKRTKKYRIFVILLIKFPDSAPNRNPEEDKGTVFYRTFVLLIPFYILYLYYDFLPPPERAKNILYIFNNEIIYIF